MIDTKKDSITKAHKMTKDQYNTLLFFMIFMTALSGLTLAFAISIYIKIY